jgi:hypothetical protein
MRRLIIDRDTADRLLAGTIAPDDAPPGFAVPARILQAAAAPATPSELVGESNAVARVALVARSQSFGAPAPSWRRPRVPRRMLRVKVGAVVVVGSLLGTSSMAGAGALLGTARDAASKVLSTTGPPAPGAGTHSWIHLGTAVGQAPSPSGKGPQISDLARTTTSTGAEKGWEISAAASDGRSKAGRQGPPAVSPRKGAEISRTARTTTGTGVDKGMEVSTAASDGEKRTGRQASSDERSDVGGTSRERQGEAAPGQEKAARRAEGASPPGSGAWVSELGRRINSSSREE